MATPQTITVIRTVRHDLEVVVRPGETQAQAAARALAAPEPPWRFSDTTLSLWNRRGENRISRVWGDHRSEAPFDPD